LSAVIAEVRALRRRAERAAQAQETPGSERYQTHLAQALEQWITHSGGRQQLLWLACAAELGLLQWHHLELGRHTLTQIDDPALSALYWTTAQRWGRLRPGMAPHASPTREAPRPAPRHDICPCEACRALQQDSRRFAPHATLEPASAYQRFDAPGSATGFRCATCDTHWVRRLLPSEHFAVWSVTQGGGTLPTARPASPRPR
jgi:hypothetical protein